MTISHKSKRESNKTHRLSITICRSINEIKGKCRPFLVNTPSLQFTSAYANLIPSISLTRILASFKNLYRSFVKSNEIPSPYLSLIIFLIL